MTILLARLNEPKYQFLIKKREGAGIKHLKDPKAFIGYSAFMDVATTILMITNQQEKEKFLFCLMTWLLISWLIRNFKP